MPRPFFLLPRSHGPLGVKARYAEVLKGRLQSRKRHVVVRRDGELQLSAARHHSVVLKQKEVFVGSTERLAKRLDLPLQRRNVRLLQLGNRWHAATTRL
ncbi:MAG: hypothetical protein COC05_02210 [Gammaproteobacteria bacterium]|nr:MAG: hypothetical protein COC05_02210 [Gammaproteobacteria bacterium]